MYEGLEPHFLGRHSPDSTVTCMIWYWQIRYARAEQRAAVHSADETPPSTNRSRLLSDHKAVPRFANTGLYVLLGLLIFG
jgi:hypothetical protein